MKKAKWTRQTVILLSIYMQTVSLLHCEIAATQEANWIRNMCTHILSHKSAKNSPKQKVMKQQSIEFNVHIAHHYCHMQTSGNILRYRAIIFSEKNILPLITQRTLKICNAANQLSQWSPRQWVDRRDSTHKVVAKTPHGKNILQNPDFHTIGYFIYAPPRPYVWEHYTYAELHTQYIDAYLTQILASFKLLWCYLLHSMQWQCLLVVYIHIPFSIRIPLMD